MIGSIEDFIRQWSLVVINYKETLNNEQLTPHNWSSGGWTYLSSEQRRAKIKTIVDTCDPQTSDGPVLDHIFHVINLEPLFESGDELTETDKNLILKTVNPFMSTIFSLLHTHQNSTITVSYNQKPVSINGFGQWFSFRGEFLSYTDLGTIIFNVIIQPFNLKQHSFQETILTMLSNYRPMTIEPLVPTVTHADEEDDPVGWCNIKVRPIPGLGRIYHALGTTGFFAAPELEARKSNPKPTPTYSLHFFQPLNTRPQLKHPQAIELETSRY